MTRQSIDKKQIQLIKIGQKQLGIDDDTYREMLSSRYGVTSCTKLSKAQATSLITSFVQRGFKIVGKPKGRTKPKAKAKTIPRAGNVCRLVSRIELEKISVLRSLAGMEKLESFNRWMLKKFKIRKVRTSNDAYYVIEGLKKVFENRMRREHGDDWWTMMFPSERVMGYIAIHCPAEYQPDR